MAQTRLTQVAIKRANAADMLLPRVSLKINTVAMDRFAAIGTLGLSGREQYSEIFHNLLVAHELGHWLQEVARRPLSRWQAEYEANRIMVAFWREYPAQSQAASTEKRLANFVAQAPNTPSPMPDDAGIGVEEYFNTQLTDIENNPLAYAGFQKLMVRQAMLKNLFPLFAISWRRRGRDSPARQIALKKPRHLSLKITCSPRMMYLHAGRMIMTIFSGIAEFERGLIRERTSAGREAARKRGVRFGRPRKLTPEQENLARRLVSEGKAVRELAAVFKVHAATIYRLAYSATGMAN